MIITTHIIIYLGYNITKQQQLDIYATKYIKTLHRIYKNMRKNYNPTYRIDSRNNFRSSFDIKVFNTQLQNYDLEISTISYEQIKSNGKLLGYEDNWELYGYKGFKYFYFKKRFPMKILIKDNIRTIDKSKYIVLLTILLNIVFISFYIFLIKKLKPLQNLKKDIVKFSNGCLDIDTSCIGKDEISEVSNEFNNAIEQIRTLTQSRNLFLRNIMHELKTPITKGILISNMMEKGKFQESIKKAFFRLDYLLNEFAQIEEFTSQNIKVDKGDYHIVEIVDNAIDMLLVEKDDIELKIIDNIIVNVDFELLSLVLKNLLDNALKYGDEKPIVLIENKTISIKNIGKQLEYKIEEYNKPFNRKYENSKESLGLGLYIINTILKTHNLKLDYKFKDGKNIFSIKL